MQGYNYPQLPDSDQNYQNQQQYNHQVNQQMYPMNQFQQGPQLSQQNPLYNLMNMGGVFIRQKVNLIEAMTGFVQKNSFKIYMADGNGQQISDAPFMTIREESDCCQRQCVQSQCRGFELNFLFLMQIGPTQWQDRLIVKTKKECSCTFFCMNRPEIEIYLQNQQAPPQYIGKIKNPFSCCNLVADAYNDRNEKIYKTHGSCCQCGVICPLPFASCQEVDFVVENSQGCELVPLQKRHPGFWRACLGPTDYFSVQFPLNATKEDRLLLIMSALTLDYMYFNDKSDNNTDNAAQFL